PRRRRSRLRQTGRQSTPAAPAAGEGACMSPYLDLAALRGIHGPDEFEPLARENMSAASYGFIAGAAGTGAAAVANREAYRRWVFRQRVLVEVSQIELGTSVLGTAISMPILFAPTALHRLAHPDGELATASAAEALGTLMIVSTSASLPLEAIKPAISRAWFQLYWFTDRQLTA